MIDEAFLGTRVGAERWDAGEAYAAVFLDEPSKAKLRDWWNTHVKTPLHASAEGTHMTIKFAPSEEELKKIPVGTRTTMRVTGHASDERGQAVTVVSDVPSAQPVAHVTMATAPGTGPVYSNKLLEGGHTTVSDGPILHGTVEKRVRGEKPKSGGGASTQSRDEHGRFDFALVCDVMTRFDFSPDQPRDDHGRFGTGVTGQEHDASPVSAKELGKLADAMRALHSTHEPGELPSASKTDDWGVSVYDRDRFSTPARAAVLDTFRNIVESQTGIAQKIAVKELRVDLLNGAHGMMTPEHEERIKQYDDNDKPLPDYVMHMPTRITIGPNEHIGAMNALRTLSDNKTPSAQEIAGLHTYVHEMCHTTSPIQFGRDGEGMAKASAYVKHGAVIEEVTTEIMARGVMAKILRETPEREGIVSVHSQLTRGAGETAAYQAAIDHVRDTVATVITEKGRGLTIPAYANQVRRMPLILNEAALAYRGEKPTNPLSSNQSAEHFAKALGAAAVKHYPDGGMRESEVAEAIRLRLLQTDADLLQRFDARTMTRFDAASSVWTVPRNDIDAAMAISNPSPDEMGVLLMLQDNPELLLQAIAKRSP